MSFIGPFRVQQETAGGSCRGLGGVTGELSEDEQCLEMLEQEEGGKTGESEGRLSTIFKAPYWAVRTWGCHQTPVTGLSALHTLAVSLILATFQ